MRLKRTLPALLLALALALAGCGDDEPEDSDSGSPSDDPRMEQAEDILTCTDQQGLPGSIGLIEGGIPAIDLSTEDETILVHVLESEEAAADYETSSDFEQEVVGNAVVLGGAISQDHRVIIVNCIDGSS